MRAYLGTKTLRTNPSSWSTEGWGELKWGMGFVDVYGAIRKFKPATLHNDKGWARTIVLKCGQLLYGEEIQIAVTFDDGRLKRISIEPVNEDSDAREAWWRNVTEGLEHKYGEPDSVTEQGQIWERKKTIIVADADEYRVDYLDRRVFESWSRAKQAEAEQGL